MFWQGDVRGGVVNLDRQAFRTAVLVVGTVFILVGFLALPAWAQDDSDPGAGDDQYAGDGCRIIAELQGNTSKNTEPFGINNTTLRIIYGTQPTNDRGFNNTDIAVVDDLTETQIDSVSAEEGEDGVLEVPVEAGRYRVDVFTFEQSYDITVEAEGGSEPCTEVEEESPQPPRGRTVLNIPPKDLPPTGGPPLLGILFAVMAGASLLTAVARRRR